MTTIAGVDVASQYAVFRATGAITLSALSGLLMTVLLVAPVEQAPATTLGSYQSDM